jgi:hypothetical protein
MLLSASKMQSSIYSIYFVASIILNMQGHECNSIDHVTSRILLLHFIQPEHGMVRNAMNETCRNGVICSLTASGNINVLQDELNKNIAESAGSTTLITVSLYNVHSWWEKSRRYVPPVCELKTNLAIGESEESSKRYGTRLFDRAFKYYDGNILIITNYYNYL